MGAETDPWTKDPNAGVREYSMGEKAMGYYHICEKNDYSTRRLS